MGQSSSQVALSQVPDQDLVPEGVDASVPRVNGATDEVEDGATVSKKRKVSAKSDQPARKRKKADRVVSTEVRDQDVDDTVKAVPSAGTPVRAPKDEPTLKVKKRKKAKKTGENHPDSERDEEPSRLVPDKLPNGNVQDKLDHEQAEPVIADSQVDAQAQEASQPSKKTKRKKPTGFKSGLNLAPAILPDEGALEIAETQTGAEHGHDTVEATTIKSPKNKKRTADDFQFRRLSKRSVDEEAAERRPSAEDSGLNTEEAAQVPKNKKRKKETIASPATGAPIIPTAATVGSQKKKKTPKHLRPLYETDTDEEETRMQQVAAPEDEASKVNGPQPDQETRKKKRKTAKQADGMPPPPAREAPTPPTSVSGSGGLRADFSEVDATDQVAGWLDSQPEAGLAPLPPSRHQSPAQQRKAKDITVNKDKKQKRRRKSAEYDDDSEDFQPEDQENVAPEPEEQSQSTQKTKQKKAKKQSATVNRHDGEDADSDDETHVKPALREKKSQRQTKAAQPVVLDGEIAKGPFTEAERSLVDDIFATMLEESSMREAEFRASITQWRAAKDFQRAVQEALPHRPKPAIRKFCQRRYHGMERGAWTADDDQRLKQAHDATPGKWTDISTLVGRTAADCKDRWKNSLMLASTMQLGPWLPDEEARLAKAVDECVAAIKKENRGDRALIKDRGKLEHMISWKVVADKMGGTRTAKRCNEKWQKMKHRAAATANSAPVKTGLDLTAMSKKLRLAEYRYSKCGDGDLYDMLTEIHTAIPDLSQEYPLESTFWGRVAQMNPHSRFDSAMRRRAYYAVKERFENDIDREQTMASTAEALAGCLQRKCHDAKGLEKTRTFTGKRVRKAKKIKIEEEDTDSDASDAAGPSSAKPKKARSTRKAALAADKTFKSAEKVEDSDSQVEESESEVLEDEDAEPEPKHSGDLKRRFSRTEQLSVESIEDIESEGEIVVADPQPTPRTKRMEKGNDGVTVSSVVSGELDEMRSAAKGKKKTGKEGSKKQRA